MKTVKSPTVSGRWQRVAKDVAFRWRARIMKVLRHGRDRHCPVCRSSVRAFDTHGLEPRKDARCPVCLSLERHRQIWVFLETATDLFDGRQKRVLHVAPERIFARRLRALPGMTYVTADLDDPAVSVHLDLTRIPCADAVFDVILCSHVLEHVADDRRAMAELCRVLAPGGWAILQVPIDAEVTFEDPTVFEPADRTRLFGHPGHVRRYGPDYADRLREAGFIVEPIDNASVAPLEVRVRSGFEGEGVLHYCRRS